MVGPSLKLIFNGAAVAFANDTVLKSGSVGIVSSVGATLDDFTAAQVTLSNASPPFSDNFSVATNQQLNNFWLNRLGNFQVAGGVAAGLGPVNLATLNGFSSANVSVQATVNVTGGKGQQAGLVTRSTGAGDGNMYFAGLVNIGTGFQVQVRRNVNGVWKTLVIATVSAGTGTLRFETTGSTLAVTFNGLPVLSITDTGLAGPGTIGMRASAGATVDNFFAT